MKKTFLAITLSSCLLFACNNSTETNNEAAPSLSGDSSTAPSVQEAPPVPSAENANTVNTTVAPSSEPAQTSAPSAKAVNPPHGQPGHVCETKTDMAAPTVTTTPAAPSSTPSKPTAPGMNPPHGEPGHDCKVAVGAPLK